MKINKSVGYDKCGKEEFNGLYVDIEGNSLNAKNCIIHECV